MPRSHLAPRPSQGTLIGLFLLALALAPAACAPKAQRKPARVPIVVAQVERRSVPFELEATGQVEPIRSADVTAQVTGLITASSSAKATRSRPAASSSRSIRARSRRRSSARKPCWRGTAPWPKPLSSN
jgi:hypothetical protein